MPSEIESSKSDKISQEKSWERYKVDILSMQYMLVAVTVRVHSWVLHAVAAILTFDSSSTADRGGCNR